MSVADLYLLQGSSTPGTNEAPIAASKSLTTQENTPLAVTLSGSDANGDPLIYSVITNPTKGTLTGTAPNLTYTPSANVNGNDSFTYKVNDGTADSAAATVSISVTPVNQAPVATSKSVTVTEDTPVAITLGGTDADLDSLTFTVVGSPAHGALSGNAPNLTYTPLPITTEPTHSHSSSMTARSIRPMPPSRSPSTPSTMLRSLFQNP